MLAPLTFVDNVCATLAKVCRTYRGIGDDCEWFVTGWDKGR
jgi:hypothetical protein